MPETRLQTSHTLIVVCFGEFGGDDGRYYLTPAGVEQMQRAADALDHLQLDAAHVLTARHTAAFASAEVLCDRAQNLSFARPEDFRGWLSGSYPYATVDAVAEVNRYRREHPADHRPLILVTGSGTAAKLHEVLGTASDTLPDAIRAGSVWQYSPLTRNLAADITSNAAI